MGQCGQGLTQSRARAEKQKQHIPPARALHGREGDSAESHRPGTLPLPLPPQDADVYILDDPLSAVDVHVGRHIFDRFICGAAAGRARLLVTNQLQVSCRWPAEGEGRRHRRQQRAVHACPSTSCREGKGGSKRQLFGVLLPFPSQCQPDGDCWPFCTFTTATLLCSSTPPVCLPFSYVVQYTPHADRVVVLEDGRITVQVIESIVSCPALPRPGTRWLLLAATAAAAVL